MSPKLDENSLYEQQENKILAQSDAFISLLQSVGYWVIMRSTTQKFAMPSRKDAELLSTTHRFFCSTTVLSSGSLR